jgi:3-oxoacyl-[acyl-carrier protein] reductase
VSAESTGLEGRLALVTGGAQGLGRADALELASCGADIAIADLNLEGADAVASEIHGIGRWSKAYPLDVSDIEAVRKTVDAIKTDAERNIDILVNNAAKMDTIVQMKNLTVADWQRDLDVNLTGAFNVTHSVWNDMIDDNYGRIVNMSSIAGLQGGFGQVVYAAAKAGTIGMTKSLALEGARHNIRVNCIAPSIVSTPAWLALPEDYRHRMEQRIPMRRVGRDEEVAKTVAYLVSDASGFVTGQCISLSGGMDLFVF